MRGEGVGRRRSKEHNIKKDSKKHHVNEVSENQDAKKDSRKHCVKKKPKRDYKESKKLLIFRPNFLNCYNLYIVPICFLMFYE